jgi:hypothetical protein
VVLSSRYGSDWQTVRRSAANELPHLAISEGVGWQESFCEYPGAGWAQGREPHGLYSVSNGLRLPPSTYVPKTVLNNFLLP